MPFLEYAPYMYINLSGKKHHREASCLIFLDASGNTVFSLILGGNETRILEVSDCMSGIYYINDKYEKTTKFVVVE